MQYGISILLSGISLGGQYALIAIGYTMVYGILRLINFAHGDVFMAAGLIMVYLSASLPIGVALPLMILLTVLLVKKVFPRPFAMAALSMVLAGAVGNLIDRALLGYVTDMFETLFMRFSVFNVADICGVVGGIAFCVYYLFFHGKEEGHGADSAAG